MTENFDKEIDALLRQTARSGDFVSNHIAMHLDADEISAFAENALPEKTRQKYILHLADCDSCRKNLSNLIPLNAEQESETIHAEEKEIVSTPIPWYRKLFVFPNLAYTMGALVLVFSGIAAFTILQNIGNSRNAEVSQTYEKQTGGGKGMSSDGDALPSESYSSNMSSNMALMNSAASNSMSVSNSAVTSAPMAAINSNMAMPANRELDKDLRKESRVDKSLNEPIELSRTEDSVAAGAPPPPPAKENSFQVDGETEKQPAQNSVSRKQIENLPKPSSVQSAPSGALRRADDKSRKIEESKDDAQSRAETTNVGGKTFRRANNAWIDSAYRVQTTINVTRGTKEYKKLDSGLRGIVENLGGTVIVVWKEKAYRIQ